MKTSLSLGLCISLLSLSAHADGGAKHPLPVPLNTRVSDSAPRSVVWEGLSAQEKNLATHLIEAARAGRDILFVHNHRDGLLIKRVLEQAFVREHQAETKALLGDGAFTELLNYAAKFEDLAGPYEGSNRKYALTKATAAQIDALFARYAPEAPAASRSEAVSLLTDPNFELMQMPETSTGEGLDAAGGNFYEHGVTATEMEQALKKGLATCLNCRVVRGADGALAIEVQTVKTPGPVGAALTKVVTELRAALPFTTTGHQRTELEHLIKFFEGGDVEEFRQANVEWVRDGTDSKVDFMMGFIEVYQDYRAQIGSWESYVQIVDPVTTRESKALARNAQYFEDAMPYGEFKKHFPKDYSPPALMVYYLQEISSMRSAGYNLPNFDDIRRDVGAKNIIRVSLPGEAENPELQRIRREYFGEFLPQAVVERAVRYVDQSWKVLVLLHEIIGHGSGTYDVSKYGEKQDPVSALGSLGSALEEQRADLTALVFGADPKLVEVGVYKSQEEAATVRDVMYDTYLADFLRHVSKERTLTEPHQRGNWLLINELIKSGAVAWTAKDGGTADSPEGAVLKVMDYGKFHDVSLDLLSRLQHIKATRDETELKRLFETDAPIGEINAPWAQAVIARGAKLAINAGSVEQPWRIKDGKLHSLCESLLLDDVAAQWVNQ